MGTTAVPPSWKGANCTGKATDDFYPEKGTAQLTARAAKKICNGGDGVHEVCQWRTQCLDYALERGEKFGVWGGMTERERYREKKRRRVEELATLAPVIQLRPDQETLVPGKAERYAARTTKKAAATPAARKAGGMLGRFAETKKTNQRLLPTVKQHLLSLPQGLDRSHHMLHVSELAKSDWCCRAAYLRIKAVRAGKPFVEETPSFQLDNVYSEGDRIHEKWQTWFWDMGVLWGLYSCTVCRTFWEDTAPKACAGKKCRAPREALRYREVLLNDEGNLIVGHADGEIRDGGDPVLLEVKSIGAGTVRIEAPKMFAEYTRKWVDDDGVARSYLDHEALWRDLRRPFPAHLRQGVIYLYLRQLATQEWGWPEMKKIVFIYEYKPTQAVKEFSIGPDDEWITEVLENCKDVVYALDNDEPPACKGGRRLCKKCKSFDDKDHDDSEPTVEARRGNGARKSTRRTSVAEDAEQAKRRTRVARRPDRSGRQRADEPARPANSLGGLLRGTASNGSNRRASR